VPSTAFMYLLFSQPIFDSFSIFRTPVHRELGPARENHWLLVPCKF